VRSEAAAATAESERLRGKIELLLPALLDAGRRLVAHPRIRELYPEYLFRSHCIIRASVPLMGAARERAQALAESDPVGGPLAAYLEGHIPEELRHDDWLLDDLEAVGVNRENVLARIPPAAVASAVGAQYYWIFHAHPIALLGYIALLEGYPPTTADVEQLMAATGYGPEAFRTMRKHAELDPHHREELDEAIDSFPLTPEQSSLMGVSAMYSVHALVHVIDELASSSRAVDGAGTTR
jgi:hypothetical protein